MIATKCWQCFWDSDCGTDLNEYISKTKNEIVCEIILIIFMKSWFAQDLKNVLANIAL